MIIFGFDYSQQGIQQYLMENLYGITPTIKGYSGIFHSSEPTAYGANAFYNAMKTTSNRANIQYMNRNCNGSYNFDAVMGFAGTKLSYMDNYSNSDGQVSIEEYKKTIPHELNKPSLIEGLDVNDDGFISVGEEAAFTLLTDYLDNRPDGIITQKGKTNAFYLINNSPDCFADIMEHFYENYTKDKEDDFEMPFNELDGSKGPYDPDTLVGKGANVGAKILDLELKDAHDELTYTNYQYIFEDENGDFDIDSGLASHTSILKIYDADRDGTVEPHEVDDKIFAITDVNDDGEISAGELLARTMVADTDNDGRITLEEKQAFQKRIDELTLVNQDELLQEVTDAYNNNSIADHEADFEMPEKENPCYPPNYGNPFGQQGFKDFFNYFLSLLFNLGNRFPVA